jgi:hypothetical protein
MIQIMLRVEPADNQDLVETVILRKQGEKALRAIKIPYYIISSPSSIADHL